eukprot:1153408-Pelagomonas_calceolata.AAC.2
MCILKQLSVPVARPEGGETYLGPWEDIHFRSSLQELIRFGNNGNSQDALVLFYMRHSGIHQYFYKSQVHEGQTVKRDIGCGTCELTKGFINTLGVSTEIKELPVTRPRVVMFSQARRLPWIVSHQGTTLWQRLMTMDKFHLVQQPLLKQLLSATLMAISRCNGLCPIIYSAHPCHQDSEGHIGKGGTSGRGSDPPPNPLCPP